MKSRLGRRLARAASERLIKPLANGPAVAPRTLAHGRKNLADARASLQRNDYEWAIVQAYYAAFHAVTALFMTHGYDEAGHTRLLQALRDCFVAEGVIGPNVADMFRQLMRWRQDAQYDARYDRRQAETAVVMAERLIEAVENAL